MKILFSGGGTGGHIYPAIALAESLMAEEDANDVLFMGAHGRVEMKIVPQFGYEIIGLPIIGMHRGLNIFRHFATVAGLIKSVTDSIKVVRKYKPDAIVCTGGFASAPSLIAGLLLSKPVVIQEQNSYPASLIESLEDSLLESTLLIRTWKVSFQETRLFELAI